jgi:hypothetical protein
MGVLTDIFRATEAELRAYYPTWRVPLEQPIRTTRFNPFVGKEMEVLSWDPAPREAIADDGQTGPPSPSIDMKGLDLDTIATLVGLGETAPAEVEALFLRGALLGPEEGPWVHEVPPSFVAKLVALDAEGMQALAEVWWRQLADAAVQARAAGRGPMFRENTLADWRGVLDILAAFARETVAEGRRMYVWVSL